MTHKRKYDFVTLGDHINQTHNLNNFAVKIKEINRINTIIHQNFADLKQICHCGAIDYTNDLLVLYAINNGAFYKINQMVSVIQDILTANKIDFGKLLVKVRPEEYKKPIIKPHLNELQFVMLEKFAAAINRPDLIRYNINDEDSLETAEDWQIKL